MKNHRVKISTSLGRPLLTVASQPSTPATSILTHLSAQVLQRHNFRPEQDLPHPHGHAPRAVSSRAGDCLSNLQIKFWL